MAHIIRDEVTQTLCCKGCGEHFELTRHQLRDPERLIYITQAFGLKHSDCALLVKFKSLFEGQVAHA